MEVRLLISQTLHGCRASVLEWGPPWKSWVKFYDSKAHCLTELAYTELAPANEVAEALDTEFDETTGILLLHSNIDPAILRAAGFVEMAKTYVN